MRRSPADTTVVEGAKWCSGCERAKPLGAFYANQWWCKMCQRIRERRRPRRAPSAEQRRRRVEMSRGYEQTPRRIAMKAECLRAYLATPLGKLMTNLRNARWRLRSRPNDQTRATIAALTAEIERLRGDE